MVAKHKTITLPETLEEWKEIESTKFNKVVDLVKYLLMDDDCPKDFINKETGEFTIPSHDPPPNAKKSDKIVIYQEFMSHSALLQRVSTAPSLFTGLIGARQIPSVAEAPWD